MAIDITNIPSNGMPLDPSQRPAADREEIKRLAQEFEAMLMTQMLREMRQSMVDEDEDKEDGFGASTMMDTADIAVGQALSRAKGVGLSDSLIKGFERQLGTPSADPATQPTTPFVLPASAPIALPKDQPIALPDDRSADVAMPTAVQTADVLGSGPISSQFGWRRDPFTGAAQFHQGVDIAYAYGRDVRAAGDGRVSFAGVQNGYGTTVVVDHANGRQTRYAHLSELAVQTGDAVTEGQILGKSGSSGRSTGPHLHFETLINGKPVDPGALDAE